MAKIPNYNSIKHHVMPKMMPIWDIEKHELIHNWKLGDSNATRNYSIPYLNILNYFAAVVVFPTKEGEVIVDNDVLKMWNVNMDLVWGQSIENLDKASTGSLSLEQNENSKTYCTNWNDGIDASRVLLIGMLAELPVFGHPVVFLPDANSMFITGTEDNQGLEIGIAAIEKAQKTSMTALPPEPIAIIDGVYAAVNILWDHPLYTRFKSLKVGYDSRVYAEQKEIMDTHHSGQLEDCYVAKFSKEFDENGDVYSYTVVSSDSELIVPQADHIVFLSEQGDDTQTTICPWEKAIETIGDQFEDLQVVPARYRIRKFPSPEQLEQLGWQHDSQEANDALEDEKKNSSDVSVIEESGQEDFVQSASMSDESSQDSSGRDESVPSLSVQDTLKPDSDAAVVKSCYECDQSFSNEAVYCPTDGALLSTKVKGSLSGTSIGSRYTLVEEIARGGMGVIYKAKINGTGEQSEQFVAIKLLLNDAHANEVVRSRFLVEARAAMLLDHPNAINVHEYKISEHGLPYLVMDHIDGLTLEELVAKGDVSRVEVIELIIQVSNALAHAHRHNVIHRDIKPSNIIITGEPENYKAIVVDFGIAKIFTQPGKTSMHLTKSGEIFGSPLYMSPEQCMGQKIDHRADVYALGCVLYELLTGTYPFDGENMLEVVFKHIHDKAEGFASDDELVELEKLVFKAMSKEPQNRHQSMLDFRVELEQCLEQLKSGESVSIASDTSSHELCSGIDADEMDTQFEYYKKQADRGLSKAQLEISIFYRDGIFVEKDLEESFEWCLLAASQDDVEAMAEFGGKFFFGVGTEVDYDKAYYWLSKAAAEDSCYSISLIAHMYETGRGVTKDLTKALEWYEKAAILEDVEAQKAMGYYHLIGEGLEKNIAETMKWYTRAAEQGDNDIQVELGLLYYNLEKYGKEGDYRTAAIWFSIAAEQNHPKALYCLAIAHEEGKGVEQDSLEALRLMKESAALGYPAANFKLGLWQREGTHSLKKNLKKAIRYFRSGADAGDPDCQYELGLHYVDGEGIARCYKTGAKWLEKSAEGGYVPAKFQLAILFKCGLLPESGSKFTELLSDCASAGLEDAIPILVEHFDELGDTENADYWRNQLAS